MSIWAQFEAAAQIAGLCLKSKVPKVVELARKAGVCTLGLHRNKARLVMEALDSDIVDMMTNVPCDAFGTQALSTVRRTCTKCRG